MPTATHLTMDDDDKDVNVATAIGRGLAMVTALGNDCIIGGLAPAGKILSTSKRRPGRPPKMYPYILRGKCNSTFFQATIGSHTTRDSAIGSPTTCDSKMYPYILRGKM